MAHPKSGINICPKFASEVLAKIDEELIKLADFKLVQKWDTRKRVLQKVKSIGLEQPEFHNHMFFALRKHFGDRVQNQPRLSVRAKDRRRNDLGIELPDCPTYIELGNGYSGGKYKEDSENSRKGLITNREPSVLLSTYTIIQAKGPCTGHLRTYHAIRNDTGGIVGSYRTTNR